MDELPIVGRQEPQIFKEVLSMGGGPAFVRRARQLEGAYTDLLQRCGQQREEWLPLVRLNVGRLFALAGDWSVLRLLLASAEHLDQLRQLHADLNPRLRLYIEPTFSARVLRSALSELRQSIERFNDRWRAFLSTIDLKAINELRDGYNRYYLMEKEAVVKSPHVARQGFQPLPPLTLADLAEVLPLLPVPEWVDSP